MADLVIQIGASAKEYQKELDAVLEKTKEMRDGLASASKIAAAGFAALSAAIGFSVKEFAEADEIARETNQILQATGEVAGVSAEQVDELAVQLADLTRFNDEAIKSGENVLLTYTRIGKDIFPAATEATLDLATKMGTDASTAARALGKALESPSEGVSALRRAGIVFTETQKQQIELFEKTGERAKAQKIILDQLNNTIGGLAKSASGGFGVFSQLRNIFGDIAEKIGANFAPAVLAAANYLKNFLIYIRESPNLLNTVAIAMGAVAVAAGTFALITGGAIAFTKLSTALELANVALAAFRIQLTAIQIGTIVGALAALAGVLYTFYAKDKEASGKSEEEKTKKAAAEQAKRIQDNQKAEDARLARQKANSDKEAEIKRQQNEVELQDQLGYSQKLIEIEKQRIANKQAILEEERIIDQLRRGEVAAENQELAIQDAEARITQLQDLNLTLQEMKAEAATVDLEQQAAFDQALAEVANTNDEKKLVAKKSYYDQLRKEQAKNILTEGTAQRAYLNQQLADEIESNNRRLLDQQRFGTVYAQINQIMHSAVYQGTKTAAGELEQLTRSNNQTLKAIGKAAAVSNIIMKTAESAMNIFNGWSSIPYVGYALGIAGAAAAVAFGAEQVGTVLGANQGGLVTGGIAGFDSVPALLTPGELVVPEQNFDEVISAVVAARTGGASQSSAPSTSGAQEVRVLIEFDGDASRLLTAQQIENRNLGISSETA